MESRRRRSVEEWQSLVDEQQASGLSAKVFCRERKLCDASFYKWRQRLSNPPAVSNPSSMPFLDLSAFAKTQAATRWQVELELGDGLVLRLGRH